MEPLPRVCPIDRAVAVSDGVVAVVITILVLGIEVPSDGLLDAAAIAAAIRVNDFETLVSRV
jgi:uncharacterized membrane protein